MNETPDLRGLFVLAEISHPSEGKYEVGDYIWGKIEWSQLTMTENMKTIHVIIASKPGTWQKFLQNEISSYPFVKVDTVAYGSLTILQAVKQYQPDILLVDTSIPAEEAIAILDHIKLESSSVLSVIIADTNQLQRNFIQKEANYVVSTFDFKSKIQSIFSQVREGFSNNTGRTEDAIGTNI